MRVFVIQYEDGREVRVKADSFSVYSDSYRFRTASRKAPEFEAVFPKDGIVGIVPQDMLLCSYEDSTLLPAVLARGEVATDFARDTLFSDAERTPFSPSERERVALALQEAEKRIVEEFQPNAEQLRDIHSKLAYLSRKVASLDRFNWKRLLVTTIVGVAVDLGFGTLVPRALLEIFKEVLSHVAQRLLGREAPRGGSDQLSSQDSPQG